METSQVAKGSCYTSSYFLFTIELQHAMRKKWQVALLNVVEKNPSFFGWEENDHFLGCLCNSDCLHKLGRLVGHWMHGILLLDVNWIDGGRRFTQFITDIVLRTHCDVVTCLMFFSDICRDNLSRCRGGLEKGSTFQLW